MLIYKQGLSENFDLFLAGDTYVKSGDKPYQLTPFLKRAYLQYQKRDLSVSAGLLVLEQFKYQRKIWQLRYVDKTFQNKFRYGENRNIGLLFKHRLSKQFSYDFAFTTGYNTPIDYYTKKYTFMAGQTFNTNFCTFSLFNHISLERNYEYVSSLFINKELDKSNFGIESAIKFSNNKPENVDSYGFSIFGNHAFSAYIMAFGRYDLNYDPIALKTKNILWTGIQFSFTNYLRTSIYFKKENLTPDYFGIAIFLYYA